MVEGSVRCHSCGLMIDYVNAHGRENKIPWGWNMDVPRDVQYAAGECSRKSKMIALVLYTICAV